MTAKKRPAASGTKAKPARNETVRDRAPRGAGAAKAPVPPGLEPRGRARGRRLTAEDWIEAGQALLREQGISAIKLSTLTQRLGVSTGSFYHHFPDFERYLGALAEDYSVERVQGDLDGAVRGGDPGPVERLRRLARRSLKAGTFDLDRAMRIWATMDPRARNAMQRGEALVLGFITQAFVDLGFGQDEAALRARILLSANVSPLVHPPGGPGAAFYAGCMDLLIRDAPALRRSPGAPGAPKRDGGPARGR